MDTNTIALVQTIGIFLGLFTIWWRLSGDMKKLSDDITDLDAKLSGEIKDSDSKLSSEIKEVRLASEVAHKEINEKLTGIQVTQASHSERFNTVNEQFNGVSQQFKGVGEQFNAVGERFNAVNERLSAVQTQVKSLDDKVDRLREGK